MTNKNLKETQKEMIADLYVRLLPYLMKDFYYKKDIDAVLAMHGISSEIIDFYATQRLATLSEALDNGEDPIDLVQPLIDLDFV